MKLLFYLFTTFYLVLGFRRYEYIYAMSRGIKLDKYYELKWRPWTFPVTYYEHKNSWETYPPDLIKL